MILTYVDEAGINYKRNETGQFHDGPVALWVGVLISELQYFHLERLYCELLSKIGIKDWMKVEAHANNIWKRDGIFSDLNEDDVIKYFDELLQLLKKLNVKIVSGVQEKLGISATEQFEEKENAKFAFLTALEHQLGLTGETSVIISDNDDGELDKLLFERTQWRYNPSFNINKKDRSRFEFETRSCFILDRVHNMDSKNSLFLQLADQVTYILKRVLNYSYYHEKGDPNFPAKKDMVPISLDTFNFFCENIFMGSYDFPSHDILITKLREKVCPNHYLRNMFTN